MKPIIGINVDVEKGPPEKASIQVNTALRFRSQAAIPVLIPPMSDEEPRASALEDLGCDVHRRRRLLPVELRRNCTSVFELCHPQRDDFDLRLINKVAR